MMRMLLVHGMLSGLVAGLPALGFAYVVGEPSLGAAINFESAEQAAKGETPGPELVSRAVQSTLGLTTGVVVYAIVLGGLFAVVFAFAYGRIGSLTPQATAAVLALVGYVVTVVVPYLKYPANPPSVSNPDTIDERTATYFGMVGLSLGFAVAATYLGRRLVSRWGAWTAWLLAATAYVVAIGVAALLLPPINEAPEQFPAMVLWNFRIASLGTQFVMWTTLGLLFGALVQRRLAQSQQATQPPRPSTTLAHQPHTE
jgi:hypothetical protein